MNKNELYPARMLVAVDGSEYSKRAVRVAVNLAKSLNSELTLFHVAGLPIVFSEEDSEITTEKLEDAKKADASILEEAAAITTGENVTVKKVLMPSTDSVARTILDYSEKNNIDLIVAGTRGLGGFKKLLLGNVASSLVHYSHCSVLVVK